MTPVRAPHPIDVESVRRRIVRDWRSLTGGRSVRDADRPTLLAVSGGADSCALAFALAGRKGVLGIGHVVHDLRPPEQAEADRKRVQELGERVGLAVHIERVRVPEGNPENQARRVRYAALTGMAHATGCRFVAVGHQADDVLETILANLIRGAGPRGIRGPAPTRRLSQGVDLVRPMLHVTNAQAKAICNANGWAWAIDATNADTGAHDAPLRSALRARVLPILEQLRPGAAMRAVRSAEAIGQAQQVVDGAVDLAWARVAHEQGGVVRLNKGQFAACQPAVREGILRRVIDHLAGERHDRLSFTTARSLDQWLAVGSGGRVVAGLRFEHDGDGVRVSLASGRANH